MVNPPDLHRQLEKTFFAVVTMTGKDPSTEREGKWAFERSRNEALRGTNGLRISRPSVGGDRPDHGFSMPPQRGQRSGMIAAPPP